MNLASLPQPGSVARAHCERLAALIEREIERAGGWISFERYMEMALYAPEYGYYTGGSAKLGGAGDFITAPELSPLFGATLARQIAQVLEFTGGDVLELGAGSGRLARDILHSLEKGVLPERYKILDVSGELVERQRELLGQLPKTLQTRVEWISSLPSSITGVVIGNEVIDALPVHLVTWSDDAILERGVGLRQGQLAWVDAPVRNSHLLQRAQAVAVPRPYLSEINMQATALMDAIGQRLKRGVVLFADYGFGAAEYYHPQRRQGTLMCHYRHRAHDDPFFLPGLQDITAHVDFSALAHTGVDAGLTLAGYTTQARFLANLGITDMLTGMDTGMADYARIIAPVQKLLSPAEMGELFKTIALSKGINQPLLGFASGDLSRLL
ncbi:MAG: class I SAM-dependent methyltransferase [Betaproteobacteria bacterium]|nr:class I SAM-dependent methyltransferase [Betaproteobacteria bacterium]